MLIFPQNCDHGAIIFVWTKNSNMEIQCHKCGKNMECNPEGKCWCKNIKFKITRKNIEKNKGCVCEDCLINNPTS